MATRLPEEQTLLEKTLYIISSIVRYEQIKPVLVWIELYEKKLRFLSKDKEADVPVQVYRRLDDKVRAMSATSSHRTTNKTDPNRISNNYRIREKIEGWKKKKEDSRRK